MSWHPPPGHRGLDSIARQQALLRGALEQHLRPGMRYALLEFPDYSNVGDSAIWLGMVRLLRDIAGRPADYVCNFQTPDMADALPAALPDGPVFICGGGNFGDLYPHHQAFRIRLLAAFPHRTIIQLPQSIQFDQPDATERTAAAIAPHRGFHLMVRDRRSLEFATRQFQCPVALVPDGAFALGPLRRPARPVHPTGALLRTDQESLGLDPATLGLPDGTPRVDWLDEPPLPRRTMAVAAALAGAVTGAWTPAGRRELLYRRVAAHRLARGVALLSSFGRVVTDRLHGHILSVLLDIPHVALDNSYGKLGGYIEAWEADGPLVRRARDAAGVRAALARIPAGG